jgi:hypothetical protein
MLTFVRFFEKFALSLLGLDPEPHQIFIQIRSRIKIARLLRNSVYYLQFTLDCTVFKSIYSICIHMKVDNILFKD